MNAPEFAGALYRAMKDGDDASFDRLMGAHSDLLDVDDAGHIAAPLISAVFCERLDCLKRMLAAGADPNKRSTSRKGSSYRLRALEAAYWMDEAEMVEELLKAGSVEDFGAAVFRGDADAVAAALDQDAERLRETYIHTRFSLLHVAAEIDSVSLVELLVARGLDVDIEDGDGHTALRYASRNEPSLAVLEALLAHGADVDHASKTGISALTSACRHAESLPTVERLLRAGADPNIVPKNRVSALMKAAGNRVEPMVRLLLEHGADPLYEGKGGETALDVARRRKADAIVAILGG